MSSITLIFPHQLFKNHPALQQQRPVYLIEEELFFNQYNFHQKKLVLHRASMKYYAGHLQKEGYPIHYIEAATKENSITHFIKMGLPQTVTEIHYADVTDDWLQRRLHKAASEKGIALIKYKTPYFLNSPQDLDEYFERHPAYFQTHFYIHQRQKRSLLLEQDGRPIGGKWTYDEENRLKLPKGQKPPPFTLPDNRQYVPDAVAYVQKHFGKNYGNTEPPFFKKAGFYPATHSEAEKWLEEFLITRFGLFGAYEDAMVPGEGLLYHSCLTPMLNTGLLTPQHVINQALDAASNYNIPLNSLEGFVRQIAGWREFIRAVYEREGRGQRTKNYWGFTRKIPPAFWQGTTGIEPVDIVIQKVLQNGYCHHIERLMVLGNFMLLCEFDPNEVYRWFMEMFVDAYDWVMVPNTYGVICFADGGLMTTKPYISGSNYLLKMGTWKRGPWQEVWDALFWRFMYVHQDFFTQNPRLGMLLKMFDKIPKAKQQQHLSIANNFLIGLDKQGK
jgi:deoxyribodipyrimidine photolyase-related protein